MLSELARFITTSGRMSRPKKRSPENMQIPSELSNYLGVRRTLTLRRIMRQSGLPVEVVSISRWSSWTSRAENLH